MSGIPKQETQAKGVKIRDSSPEKIICERCHHSRGRGRKLEIATQRQATRKRGSCSREKKAPNTNMVKGRGFAVGADDLWIFISPGKGVKL